MNARTPAEVFPPGEFLREELGERGWSQQELADIMGRPPRLISELISGKRAITPETAKGLAEAFGTSAEYWLSLEGQYQLSKIKTEDKSIARKAALYSRFPVREMIRRGWVQASENLDVLEHRFCEFFGIREISAEPELLHYAKKTHAHLDTTPLQKAWLFRVRTLAEKQDVPVYSPEKLRAAVEMLRALRVAPEGTQHVVRILADAGVRLVFVEAMPGSKIDGAAFWPDGKYPVIGLTLRFDRIDNFWFVLRHEIEHVLREDGKVEAKALVDSDMGGQSDSVSECEIRANQAGADFCVSTAQLEDFVARVQPYFSEKKVMHFAERINVHPGLVVGQLQRRLNRHDFLRKHQVRVREYVLQAADFDGWGSFSE
jgi:HTH-type transcriptional regulator/antitoxin HigA